MEPPLPPEELTGVYERIDDELSLVGDNDVHFSQPAIDGTDDAEYEEEVLANPRYFNEYSRELNRRGVYVHDSLGDEQRLRNVTSKDSPVFSKPKVSRRRGLNFESLQRRSGEFQPPSEYETYDAFDSAAHVRPIWGDRNGIGANNEESGHAFALDGTRDNDSNFPPVSRRSGHRVYGDGTGNGIDKECGLDNDLRDDDASRELGDLNNHGKLAENLKVPDIPTTIYENSTFVKPSPRKRDSQSLLRKLSRAEVPSQMKTPEQQKSSTSKIYDKTPVVTGAYIGTPLPERETYYQEDNRSDGIVKQEDDDSKNLGKTFEPQAEEKPKLEAPTVSKKEKLPLKKPKLPKSALEAVIEEAKSGDASDPLGDSTLESVENFKEWPCPSTGDEDDMQDGEKSEVFQKAVEEDLAREAKKLERKEDSKHEASKEKREVLLDRKMQVGKGRGRLEKRQLLDTGPHGDAPPHAKEKGEPQKLERGANLHHEHCERCSAYNDHLVYAVVPLPKLWKRNPRSRRIQITFLGLCILGSISWLLTELTMCDIYCHPLVAETCTGNCLMPDAPEFPYVIPTMLWRWLHIDKILAPILTIVMIIVRWIMLFTGLSDGLVDDEPAAFNPTPQSFVNKMADVPVPDISVTASMTVPSEESWPGYDATSSGWASGPRQFEHLKYDDELISMDDDEYVYV